MSLYLEHTTTLKLTEKTANVSMKGEHDVKNVLPTSHRRSRNILCGAYLHLKKH